MTNCKYCNRPFNEEHDARICEYKHLKKEHLTIESVEYEEGYIVPTCINIKDVDGVIRQYHLHHQY